MRITPLVMTSLFFVSSLTLADEERGRQQPMQLRAAVKVEMGYLLYKPQNYDQQESWPLLVFLHGIGERGKDLKLVTKHGPPKLIAEGKEFPFLVVSPQCPPGQWWEPVELVALLDEIERTCKVDPDRVYITGLSMGGFGTWRLAGYAPQRIAAIAPICGGGEPSWTRDFAHLPVWAFHGAKDRAVPLERTEQMVEALRRAGGEPKLTVYPEADHDSWTETYNNPELYQWLLEQRRVKRNQNSR